MSMNRISWQKGGINSYQNLDSNSTAPLTVVGMAHRKSVIDLEKRKLQIAREPSPIKK
jgi:hypothetical protein